MKTVQSDSEAIGLKMEAIQEVIANVANATSLFAATVQPICSTAQDLDSLAAI